MWDDDPELYRIFEFGIDPLRYQVVPKSKDKPEQHVFDIRPFRLWLAYQEHLIPQSRWKEAHEWARIVEKAANDAGKGVLREGETTRRRGELKKLTPEQAKARREQSPRGN